MSNKIKLLQTAKEIYERGDVKLSSSDRKRIEDETRELLRRSVSSRSAAKAPESFRAVLAQLKESKDADDAYGIVIRHMVAEGLVEEKELKDEVEDVKDLDSKEPKEMKEPKGKEPKDMKEPKDDEPKGSGSKGIEKALEEVENAVEHVTKALEKVEDMVGKEDGKEDKPEIEDKEDKEDKEGGKPGFGKEKDEKPDFGKEKEEVIKMAQALEPKKLDRGKGMGKEKSFDISKMKKDRDKQDVGTMNNDEMGVEPEVVSNAPVRVAITRDKNIAVYGRKGPLFIAVPNVSIKRDAAKLRKAANKVYGLVIYEGPEAAAKKCGATLLAGADSDILTDSVYHVEPATKGVTDKRFTDTRGTQLSDSKTVLEDVDTDTKEKKEKVTAIKKKLAERIAQRKTRKPARFSVVSDSIIDDPLNEVKRPNEVNPNSLDSGKGGDTDTKDNIQTEPKQMLEGSDTDYQKVEANYKKLYASRARREVVRLNDAFVSRFGRCLNIAARRMELNHDDDPIKIAAGDILTAENIRFANGDRFDPMDGRTAKELIELIAAEGHQNFVKHLLGRAADLMEKSDSYLKDAEADLKNLKPVDPMVDEVNAESCSAPKKAMKLRRSAREGNFQFNPSSVAIAPANALRDAVGLTKVSRTASNLKKAVGR